MIWALLWAITWWAIDGMIWDDPIWEWVVLGWLLWAWIESMAEEKTYTRMEAFELTKEAYKNGELGREEYWKLLDMFTENPSAKFKLK